MKTDSYLDTIDRIGFTIPEHHGSGIKIEGLLRIDSEGLIIEYAPLSTSSSGMRETGEAFKKWANKHLGFEFETEGDSVKTLKIPFSQLEFLKRRNFFFFGTILIVSDSIRTFRSLPSQRHGRLTVFTSWHHRQEAARFVSHFNMNLADWRMSNADEMLEKVRKFEA
jgi:hypothetical protein